MEEEQIAEEAMMLIQQGGVHVEKGASLLCRKLNKRVQRYFERHRVPEAQAEELVNEVWLKLIISRFDGRTRAIVWLWMVARSVLLDWVAKAQALRRGSATIAQPREVGMDDDAWNLIHESVATTQAPAWVTLCLERAAFEFERDEPRRAEVLRFKCENWSAEEIAIYYSGSTTGVTEKQKTAARNRLLDALRRARSYFEHCKDHA